MNLKPAGSTRALVIILLAAFPGCMSPTYEHKASPSPGQVFSTDPGGANISGEVSVTTKTGEIRKAADTTVYLIPLTDYSKEWFDHYIVRGEKMSGKDPRSFASTRAASVDTEGRFQFRQVPGGRYYLTCTVQYQRSNFRLGRLNFGMRSIERVEAYAELKLESGQTAEVPVTRPPA